MAKKQKEINLEDFENQGEDILDSLEVTKKKTKKESKQKNDLLDFEREMQNFLKADKKLKIEVSELSERAAVPYFYDTGNYAYNWVLSNDMRNGGYPGCKCIDIAADPSAGKSLLIAQALVDNIKNHNGISYIKDTEDSYDKDFIGRIAKDTTTAGKIKLVDSVKNLEDLETFLVRVIDFKASKKDGNKMVIGIDSMTQLPSKEEKNIAIGNTGKVEMKKAGLIKRIFRLIDDQLRDANVTVFTAQHLIADIGNMFNPVTTSGGKGIPYGADVRIQLFKPKQIVDAKSEHPLGITLSIKTTKNRFAVFGRKCNVDIYYSTGIDRYSGLAGLLAQYGVIESSAKDMTASTKLKFTVPQEIFSQIDAKYHGDEDNQILVTYKNFKKFASDHDSIIIDWFNSELDNNVKNIEDGENQLLAGEFESEESEED